MKVTEAILTRRSVKQYEAGHQLSEQELRTLVSAAALAPSSFNMQNRHVVAVVSQEVKTRLQAAAFGQAQVRDASVVLVLTGDLAAHRRTDRYLRKASADVRQQLEPMIAGMYEGKPALLRDEACRSVGLAAMNLMLTARELGYDSGPMIGFDAAAVSELLGLDEQHPPLMIVVVGKAARPAHPRLGLLDLEEQVSIDHFGNNTLVGALEG